MRHHGLLIVGRDAGEAVKTAALLEDAARTVHMPSSSATGNALRY
jgi:ribulose-5-phosphate 4-epimerase/fuculose-1-phosphate aldolase